MFHRTGGFAVLSSFGVFALSLALAAAPAGADGMSGNKGDVTMEKGTMNEGTMTEEGGTMMGQSDSMMAQTPQMMEEGQGMMDDGLVTKGSEGMTDEADKKMENSSGGMMK